MPKFITLSSPLGDEAFELLRLTGQEALSSVYQFDIDLYYHGKTLKPNDLIGQSVTINLLLPDQKTRYFNGIVSRFSQGIEGSKVTCRLQIAPKLWLLQFNRQSRIFQQLSVKAIISQILKEHGVKNNLSKLSGNYPNLDYCVQWQESDFSFIARLMEQWGIFYSFEHQKNDHVMTLADNVSAYKDGLKQAKIISTKQPYAQIRHWQVNHQFYAGKVITNDHDFTNPSKQLVANHTALQKIAGNDQYEVYHYHTGHQTTEQGAQLSKLRMEQLESNALIGQGSSLYTDMAPGQTLSFDPTHMPAEKGKTYVVTALQHHLTMDANKTDDAWDYTNDFWVIPAQTVFRPPLVTQKPIAPSNQLANVVGPSGKDIYTDNYGRMKVQFIWDKAGKANEKSSCWMRAVQHWEGLLRIGTPVVVGFIDGDIDQPFILGPVYNADLMPLYPLEQEQTKSSFKRRPFKKADEKTYNEIRFEDKKEQQELYIHATKDLLIEAENNATYTIKQKDLLIQVVKGQCSIQVKKDMTINVEGNLQLNGKQSITLQSNGDISLKGQNLNLHAKANATLQAASKLTQQAMEIAQTGNAKLTLKAPMQTLQSDGLLILKGGLIKEN